MTVRTSKRTPKGFSLNIRFYEPHPLSGQDLNRGLIGEPYGSPLGVSMSSSSRWNSSNRRKRLPKNWNSLRKTVLKRDPQCKLRYEGCQSRSTEVDHVIAGDDHRLTNLQGVCGFCHRLKSSAEGRKANQERRSLRLRPQEKHPGLRKPRG